MKIVEQILQDDIDRIKIEYARFLIEAWEKYYNISPYLYMTIEQRRQTIHNRIMIDILLEKLCK